LKKDIVEKNCLICKSPCKIFQKNIFDDRYGAPGKYSIYKCSDCGYGRIKPLIDQEKIGKFYSEYYPLNLKTAEQVKKEANIKPKWLAWLMGTNNTAHWLIKPKSTVLDIGSASGISLMEIKKMGGDAYGVEPNPSAQKIAKKLGLHVYEGFITDNLFPKQEFDFITASQVLEHDPNPKTFLEAIRKKLKKNGIAILSFPNCDSIYRKIFKKKWINWHVPYHCNFFTKTSFIKITKFTGYKVLKMQTVTPNIWTILQVRRLFAKPEEGKKDAIWKVHNKSLGGVTIIILKLLRNIIMVVLIPINRLIDLFGQGDSFIVVLEKKYE